MCNNLAAVAINGQDMLHQTVQAFHSGPDEVYDSCIQHDRELDLNFQHPDARIHGTADEAPSGFVRPEILLHEAPLMPDSQSWTSSHTMVQSVTELLN